METPKNNKGSTVGKISSLSETEKAYIAGFLDGDGSIIGSVEKHKGKVFKYRVRIIVKFSQHVENVSLLKFLKKLIGEGYISKSGTVAELVVKSQDTVENFLTEIEPFVFLKRKQIAYAKKILKKRKSPMNKKNFILLVRWAYKIGDNNLKSKSRKKLTLQNVLEDISCND